MASGYAIHGHAIVSDDDKIADAGGHTPRSLRHPADWKRFQAAMDGAAVTILGRLGHMAHPNAHGRNRIVLSSSASGIERRDGVWWWNPARASLEAALAVAAPSGGIVVVPGGRRVFDLFLQLGFDEFHLARVRGVTVPDGIPIFSESSSHRSAETVLAAHGLEPQPTEMLDAEAGVSVTVWRRRAPG
ncbi:MAG: hypothetical protein IT539_08165 [Bradyrhizobiaceae bacterium]|nr:hypothetical protein [Bradyrhizobiaceae bacterium]